MNLNCINCQASRPSVPYDELEQQHNCPVCGDELVPAPHAPLELRDATELRPVVHLDRAA
jgi:hypothetical protein